MIILSQWVIPFFICTSPPPPLLKVFIFHPLRKVNFGPPKKTRKKERLYGDIGNPTKAGDLTYLGSPTSMWTGPNTHTTTRELRRICCSGTKPELTLLERLVDWELNVKWEHLFRTILKWFRRKNQWKITSAGYERHKGKQQNKLSCPIIYLVFTLWRFTRKTEIQLNSG